MRSKVILTLLVATVFGVLTGCSSTGNPGTLPGPASDRSAQVAGFKLDVLPDSYIDGSSAGGYELSIKDYGKDIVVSVTVEDAQNMKALYFDLDYNPEQYRPMTVATTDLLGEPSDLLSLTSLRNRGTVTHGQVIGNYEWRTGFSGNGVIAQVMFREEATPALPRSVSNVPTNDFSASDLTYDEGNATAELRWDFAHRGDYDQNGLVTISDLSPLGAALGETVAPADFPRSTKLSHTDADQNGAITLAEISFIGSAMDVNSGITGYNIYATTDDSLYPAENTSPTAPTLVRIGQVPVSPALGNASNERLYYEFDLSTTPSGTIYWVRPYQTTDNNEGTPSDKVGPDVVGPSLTLLAPPVVGDGSAGAPYQVNEGDNYMLVLTDPVDGDVSSVGAYQTNDPSHVTFAGAQMTILAGAAANFSVSARYNGADSINQLHFTTASAVTGLTISPLDTSAAPWDGVDDVDNPLKGTNSANAYILHDSGFNPDGDSDGVYDLAFPLKAEDDLGDDLDESLLSWGSFPPFVALDIDDAPKGEFHVNLFSDGYVFAMDGVDSSNDLWIGVNLDVN